MENLENEVQVLKQEIEKMKNEYGKEKDEALEYQRMYAEVRELRRYVLILQKKLRENNQKASKSIRKLHRLLYKHNINPNEVVDEEWQPDETMATG